MKCDCMWPVPATTVSNQIVKPTDFFWQCIDDFITLGQSSSPQCQCNLEGIIQVCRDTGTPLEEDKCQGPAQAITLLGIELDTQTMEIRLPEEKLDRLRKLP